MPMLRRCGGSVSMRVSPKLIRPASSSAKPAMSRNRVVLPQPDGPSSVKNSPSSILRVMSRTATTDAKDRRAPSMAMLLKAPPLARLLHEVLDLIERLRAHGGPGLLAIIHELDRLQVRHAARQRRQIEVLARRPAEGAAQDHLAHVFAVDVV